MNRGLGSNLRIACFSEWNYFFLITNLRHTSFLQSSGFIDQATDSGSGDPVLLRHFCQAQTGEAVLHNSCTVNVQRRTAYSASLQFRSPHPCPHAFND